MAKRAKQWGHRLSPAEYRRIARSREALCSCKRPFFCRADCPFDVWARREYADYWDKISAGAGATGAIAAIMTAVKTGRLVRGQQE